jgi:hypothetical protein
VHYLLFKSYFIEKSRVHTSQDTLNNIRSVRLAYQSPHHSTYIEQIRLLKRMLGERASALSLVQELLHRKK